MAKYDSVPFHRNPKIIAVFMQILIAAIILGFFYWLYLNTVENLERANKPTGFGFLDQVAPFQIGYSPFLDFKLGESTYWKVFFIGIQNTIFVSILGIIAATILGFIVGIMRLSPNWIVSRIALVYIEILRNIPLLLQILFWNFAIFLPSMPAVKDSIKFGESVYLNNRGFYLPKMISENPNGFMILFAVLAIAIAGIIYMRKWAKQRQNQTGQTFPLFLTSLAILLAATLLGSLIAGIGLEFPKLGRFNLSGGIEFPLPLFALWFALTTYTSAFIAENVRAGIQSVNKGQTEASSALGLPRKQTLNLVVIPQAMRVIIPPTISQFLNLTKNSSLAVAISYEEIVNIWAGIALNQTGQALIIIGMTFAVYQTLSLIISGASNYYNSRTQLVGR
ncbi:MAG: amino acid ABC transporter permease [Nitratireductor sp.]